MSLFTSCFGSYSPASSLQLPESPGKEREDAIVKLALEGNVPYFNRDWIAVPVFGGGLVGTIFVTPDYFSLGTDQDFLRMPMAPLAAEAVASMVGARLPTKKMVNSIHAAANLIPADPWGPPYDSSMMATSRFIAHNEKIEKARTAILGSLVSGHKKDVVVSPQMDGSTVCIYGWFRNSALSSAIQGPMPNCKSHELSYADYSHGIRLVRNDMVVDGKPMLVDAVMRDPKLHLLVSDQGVFGQRTRYVQSYEPSSLASSSLDTGSVITAAAFFALGYAAVDLLS